MISPAKLASSLFLLEEGSNRSNLLQIRNRTNLDVGMKRCCGEVSTTTGVDDVVVDDVVDW